MAIHDWTKVDAGIFHDFHLMWIAELRRALRPLLPSDYYALAEQVTGSGNPDVLTLNRSAPDTRDPDGSSTNGGGGIATATRPPKTLYYEEIETNPYARLTRSVVIRHVSGHEIIALIELVSPGNKGSREEFDRFVRKTVDFLNAGVNVLILDLFPPTSRDPQGIHRAITERFQDSAIGPTVDKPLTLVADRVRAYVEPIGVGDKLPDMPLFLTPRLYVSVPLETTYQASWAEVPDFYRNILDEQS